jgi:hypothetical protein
VSRPGSQVPNVAFWVGSKKSLQSVLSRTLQTCLGRNRDPKGAHKAKQKTECRWALERPEAVTEHKMGYKTGDTLQSKALICTRPAELQRNGDAIRADMSSARTAVLQFSFSDTLSSRRSASRRCSSGCRRRQPDNRPRQAVHGFRDRQQRVRQRKPSRDNRPGWQRSLAIQEH